MTSVSSSMVNPLMDTVTEWQTQSKNCATSTQVQQVAQTFISKIETCLKQGVSTFRLQEKQLKTIDEELQAALKVDSTLTTRIGAIRNQLLPQQKTPTTAPSHPQAQTSTTTTAAQPARVQRSQEDQAFLDSLTHEDIALFRAFTNVERAQARAALIAQSNQKANHYFNRFLDCLESPTPEKREEFERLAKEFTEYCEYVTELDFSPKGISNNTFLKILQSFLGSPILDTPTDRLPDDKSKRVQKLLKTVIGTITKMIKQCPNLETLDLAKLPLSGLDENVLPKTIQTLKIDGCSNIKDLSNFHLEKCDKLKDVYIKGTKLTSLNGLQKCTNLESIFGDYGDETLQDISAISKSTHPHLRDIVVNSSLLEGLQ